MKADRLIGQLLALKKIYIDKAKKSSVEEDKCRYLLAQTLLHHAADYEFKYQIRAQSRRKDMKLRNSGIIVLPLKR